MAIWVPIVFLIGLAIGIHEGYKHGEHIGYLRGRRDEFLDYAEDFFRWRD